MGPAGVQVVRGAMVEPDLIDETLQWDHLIFPLGTAILTDGSPGVAANGTAEVRVPTPGDTNQTYVAKRWALAQIGDQQLDVLIESVPWTSIQSQLASLPLPGHGAIFQNNSEKQFASAEPRPSLSSGTPVRLGRGEGRGEEANSPTVRPTASHRVAEGTGVKAVSVTVRRLPAGIVQLGQPPQNKPPTGAIKLASAPYHPKGCLIDYIEITSGNPILFDTGTTIFVHYNTYFSGTNLTINPGCTIKYATNTYLQLYCPLVSNCDATHTSTFTSMDDTNVGQTITNATGQPTYTAARELWFYYVSSPGTVRGLNFQLANTAVRYDGVGCESSPCSFSDSQVLCCLTGISANSSLVAISSSTECATTTPTSSSGCEGSSITGSFTHWQNCDINNDGLPSWWELKYWGHLGISPSADADGDGVSNYVEYMEGRNPMVSGTTNDTATLNLQVYTPLR
jgi:hypothetical protein